MSALYCFEEREKQGRYSLVSNVDIRVLRVTAWDSEIGISVTAKITDRIIKGAGLQTSTSLESDSLSNQPLLENCQKIFLRSAMWMVYRHTMC